MAFMLTGKHVQLRRVEPDDYPAIQTWQNDPEVFYWMDYEHAFSLDDIRRSEERACTEGHPFVIVAEYVEPSLGWQHTGTYGDGYGPVTVALSEQQCGVTYSDFVFTKRNCPSDSCNRCMAAPAHRSVANRADVACCL